MLSRSRGEATLLVEFSSEISRDGDTEIYFILQAADVLLNSLFKQPNQPTNPTNPTSLPFVQTPACGAAPPRSHVDQKSRSGSEGLCLLPLTIHALLVHAGRPIGGRSREHRSVNAPTNPPHDEAADRQHLACPGAPSRLLLPDHDRLVLPARGNLVATDARRSPGHVANPTRVPRPSIGLVERLRVWKKHVYMVWVLQYFRGFSLGGKGFDVTRVRE